MSLETRVAVQANVKPGARAELPTVSAAFGGRGQILRPALQWHGVTRLIRCWGACRERHRVAAGETSRVRSRRAWGHNRTRDPEIFCRRTGRELLASQPQLVTYLPPALAVIDGTLCQLTREGSRAGGHAPFGSAVVEFRHGPLRYYVREHPFGLLPGLPNLYCLDADFRLQWMAEWPDSSDPCAAIAGEENDTLVAVAASGAVVRLDAHTGRLRSVQSPMAAAI
jgi:hypothetical protein